MKKRIAILGSTGSVGTQTLDVIAQHSGHFVVEVLTAMNNYRLLIEQALQFEPNVVVIGNEKYYAEVFEALNPYNVKVYAGSDAIVQITEMESIDLVLMAIVGFDALRPTLAAIENKKPLALANKECLVAAGELLMHAALKNHSRVVPVDSEHSAIFQCLMGEGQNTIEKIVLTGSGGPFRNKSEEFLETVLRKQALAHPNWNMGNKVSIDSATLMNKGLEAIEAKWLFNLNPEQIEVIIHPESVVHSLVYFADASVKAQLGLPDMRIAIQFALSYPERFVNKLQRLDLLKLQSLHFYTPDNKIFRNLALAFEALRLGGNMPCILNAANELAVEAFLKGRIAFLQMPQVVEDSFPVVPFVDNPSLDDLMETDRMSRRKAKEIINKLES